MVCFAWTNLELGELVGWLVDYVNPHFFQYYASCLVVDQNYDMIRWVYRLQMNFPWRNLRLKLYRSTVYNHEFRPPNCNHIYYIVWNQCIISMPHTWHHVTRHLKTLLSFNLWQTLYFLGNNWITSTSSINSPIGYWVYTQDIPPPSARWGRRIWSYGFLFGHRHPLATGGVFFCEKCVRMFVKRIEKKHPNNGNMKYNV